ncbi:hypothetical protein B9Z55_013232 [Caenorhabditis nigoni]|uniref:Alpha/beta hydrolase fold-3 domain-containing protein n=2 Tax=Caenorhabditis nigoni TaxID=1611254 RepID=A0A2G5U127_9PELO|nr:hypothetical protein B9Z55_013232 [Caenorhabditis nigoni]
MMLKAEKEQKKRLKYTAIGVTVMILLIIGYSLHKPLPEGFTVTKWDRAVMHVVEPALRVAYYYPSRMFSKASNMVYWTRGALNILSKTLGLLVDTQGQIDIKWHEWNGTPVKVYRPIDNRTSTDGAVIFIHGGGFALGNVEMYDSLVERMAFEMKTLFISVEYRLSPETVFPGGILDCEAAIDYFFDNASIQFGVNTSKIVIMGDSAGGNLATVIAQRRAARNASPALAGQVLIYPLLQMADMQTISYRYFHSRLSGYALVDPESVAYYYMFYAGIDMDEKAYLIPSVISNGHVAKDLKPEVEEMMSHRIVIESTRNYRNHSISERWEIERNFEAQDLMRPFLTNPDFSPLMRKDLSNLPPTMVLTCEFDVLRDEGLIYAQRLEAAGVPTTTINYENGFHAMLNFHSELHEASKSVEDIEQWTLNVINNA